MEIICDPSTFQGESDDIEFVIKLGNEFEKIINDIDAEALAYCSNIYVTTAAKSSQHSESDLHFIRAKNNELINAIEELSSEIKEMKTKVSAIEQDKALYQKEVKDIYEAFLMAKTLFQTRLNTHFQVGETDSEGNFELCIQFFTEKATSEGEYSVKLLLNETTQKIKLISTTPTLSIFEQIQAKLSEKGDIIGALWCIRNIFINMRKKSKSQK